MSAMRISLNYGRQTRKKNEKQTHRENKIDEEFSFTDDRRGLHQQHYQRQAKIYQREHLEQSYREALKFGYKNNNKIKITI